MDDSDGASSPISPASPSPDMQSDPPTRPPPPINTYECNFAKLMKQIEATLPALRCVYKFNLDNLMIKANSQADFQALYRVTPLTVQTDLHKEEAPLSSLKTTSQHYLHHKSPPYWLEI